MAKGRTEPESVVAFCADYDESAEEEVKGTRKVANVGAKRSSDTLVKGGGAEIVPVTHSDLASDSGYSSRTQATSASADSTASIRAKAEQAAALQDFLNVSRQHLAPEDGETHSQRSGSTASTNTKIKKRVACKEPNCDKCVAARRKAAEAAGRKLKPKISVDTNASPVKSRERSPVKQPTSTTLVRQKPEIHQQPAHPQPRRRDSQQAGPRPQSMYEMSPHPGMDPRQAAYYQRVQHPGNPNAVMVVERPGQMVSARGGARGGMRGAPTYNPQAGAVPSARRVPNPTVVQVDNRPDDRAVKMQQQMANAQRAQQVKPQPRHQVIESPSDSEEEDEEEYSEDGEEYDEEESEEESEFTEYEDELAAQKRMRALKKQQEGKGHDSVAEIQRQLAAHRADEARLLEQQREQQRAFAIEQQRRQHIEEARRAAMPPPQLPPSALPAGMHLPSPSSQAGPSNFSMRKLPQITYGERRPSELEHLDPDLRATLRSMTPGPSGSSANRRPSLASSGGTKATSYSHPGHPHVITESRTGRRMSYMGTEGRGQLENMHHGFQQQRQSMDMEQIIANMVHEQLANLNITPEKEHRVNFAMDDKLKHAMQYQSNVDHVGQTTRRDTLTDLPNIPLTQAALRRNAGIPSLSGSSRSKRSSDEDPSLVSAGHRLTSGSEAGVQLNEGEMKVLINYSNGFEMEVEGRRVTLVPVGDGTAQLIIGGAQRGETSYMSARGSTATKSVINRQPSQRQRRPTRDDVFEVEDSDDRTERRTVYRDDRRRDLEELRREEEEAARREARRLEKQDREREREEKRLRKERKAIRREKAELLEMKREQDEQRQRRRRSKYDEETQEEDETSETESSEEDDRRTQRTARRPRAKTYEDRPKGRRSPEKRHRDDGNYRYPSGYGYKSGFTPNPQF